MLSATLHNSTQRLGINTPTKGIYFTAAVKGKIKAAKPKVEPNSSYTFVIMLMNDAPNPLNGSMHVCAMAIWDLCGSVVELLPMCWQFNPSQCMLSLYLWARHFILLAYVWICLPSLSHEAIKQLWVSRKVSFTFNYKCLHIKTPKVLTLRWISVTVIISLTFKNTSEWDQSPTFDTKDVRCTAAYKHELHF